MNQFPLFSLLLEPYDHKCTNSQHLAEFNANNIKNIEHNPKTNEVFIDGVKVYEPMQVVFEKYCCFFDGKPNARQRARDVYFEWIKTQ